MSCFGYQEVTCGGCSITYHMPVAFYKARKRDHKTFTCPNGCVRHYPGKTAEERRIKELEAEVREWKEAYQYMHGSRDSWREMAEHEQRRRVGYQGALSRARKNPDFLRRVEA